LDEPTEGLDPRQIIEIREMIRNLADEHTVLLSTHILPEVALVCERVLIINRGRLVAQESTDALTAAGDKVSLDVESDAPEDRVLERLRAAPGVTGVTAERPGRYIVEGAAKADLRPAVSRALVEGGCSLLGLKPRTRTLEELFIEAVSSDGEVGE
ncbi:MAG: hypothetical protein JXR94_09695, partial [Candidatus Hydrogenedentes bacterium]|nr:hypothetical protein [Candidatus Hydrogenedentota bacterium]